jgi:hypothetical protein
MSELLNRYFSRQWNYEMAKLGASCPNTFYLMPGGKSIFNPRNWTSEPYQLYLVCQNPAEPHSVGKGYTLQKGEEWWLTMLPWINRLVKFLKFAIPMGKSIGLVYDEDAFDEIKNHYGLLEQIAKSLKEILTTHRAT